MDAVTYPSRRLLVLLYGCVVCVPVNVFVFWSLLGGYATFDSPKAVLFYVFGPVVIPAFTAWIIWSGLRSDPAVRVTSDGVEAPLFVVAVPWADFVDVKAVKGALRRRVEIAVTDECWQSWAREHPVRRFMLAGTSGVFSINVAGDVDEVVTAIELGEARWHRAG